MTDNDRAAASAASRSGGPIVFSAAFRIFFLLAGLHATLAVALWALWLAAPGGAALGPAMHPVGWHAHEMLFGFTVAAAAGFLLTAVPHWTGCAEPGRGTVMLLAGLWLAGRIGLWAAGLLPEWLVAAVDLAFLPVLIGVLARALLPTRKPRNQVFLPLLMVWWLCALLSHLEFMGIAATGTYGRRLAIDVAAVMMVLIGGRIVPTFTRTWMQAHGRPDSVRQDGALEKVAVGLALLMLILHALAAWWWLTGIVALLAGVAVLWRLSHWNGMATLGEPILFVLHVGYGWIGLAFLTEAAAHLFDWLPPTTAWHAMTVGAVGTLTLAVMSRAALGHSGRVIVAAPLTSLAYLLVGMAALVRVFGPALKPGAYLGLMVSSGVLWSLAFLCFLVVYAPILTRPRRIAP